MSKRVFDAELMLEERLSEVSPPSRKRRKVTNENDLSPYQTVSTTVVQSPHPKLCLFLNVFTIMSNKMMINANGNLKKIKLWDNLLNKFSDDAFNTNMSRTLVNMFGHIDRNAKWKTVKTIKAEYNYFDDVKY